MMVPEVNPEHAELIVAQRPSTASRYGRPADLALAATAVSRNQGWASSRETNRCPTIPVAPRTPTLRAYAMMQA
jgi:hypothetical protein